jgi:hypothetical protein
VAVSRCIVSPRRSEKREHVSRSDKNARSSAHVPHKAPVAATLQAAAYAWGRGLFR